MEALIVLGTYILTVIISALGFYIDFRKYHRISGRSYTLEDLYNTYKEIFWVIFVPLINILILLIVVTRALLYKIKDIVIISA